MGYRSEVGVLFTLPTNKTIEQVIKELLFYYPDLKEDFSITTINEDKEYLFIRTKFDLKWYKNFTDVKDFMGYLYDFGELKDAGVHYLRIGENYEDIEEIIYGKPLKYLKLERYIDL